MKRFVFFMILAIGAVSIAFASPPERIKEPANILYDVGYTEVLPWGMSFDNQYCGETKFSEVIYTVSTREAVTYENLPWDHGLKICTNDSKQIINLTYHTMSKITESELNALKVKYKHIEVVTVVIEPYKLDRAKLSDEEINDYKEKGINILALADDNVEKEFKVAVIEKLIKLGIDVSDKIIDAGEIYQFAARRPDRGHVSILLPLAEKKELGEFADKAVSNLIVGGDVDALEDGLVYMGVVAQLKAMISPAGSFLKKA